MEGVRKSTAVPLVIRNQKPKSGHQFLPHSCEQEIFQYAAIGSQFGSDLSYPSGKDIDEPGEWEILLG